MAVAAMKHMALNFAMLDKFEGMLRMLSWNNSGRGPNEIMMTMFAECGKPEKLKKDCKGGKVGNKGNGLGINGDSSNSLKGLSQWFWGEAMAIVRLSDPKLKTLGEKGIECIFIGYAEHSKAFRFSSVPKPNLKIPNETKDTGGSVVPEEVVTQQPELDFRNGTMDEVSDQHSYCFNVEDDPKIFDKAMKSQNVAFWKEAINDEMDSILSNNT
ncbi:hypothetical protein Tco_1532712 [Tanacetum coccineum]